MLGTMAIACASASSDRGISFCGITIACANTLVALITTTSGRVRLDDDLCRRLAEAQQNEIADSRLRKLKRDGS